MRRNIQLLGILAALLPLLAACYDESTADAQIEGAGQGKGGAMALEKTLFGAGCFWGVEETFARTPGVKSTAVGYAGGTTDHPTYRDVCSGSTGHAEVCEVEFDPAEISYEQLLEVFWEMHDPTQLNRQGPDVGTQYRSVIFYHSAEQAAAARASMERLAGRLPLGRPLATQLEPAPAFWRAEEYHQRYIAKRGGGFSCH